MNHTSSNRGCPGLDQFNVFPWNKSFETGIQIIDDQHKQLVRLLNELGRTLVDSKPIEVSRAFDELAEYAEKHFADEEAIWWQHIGDDYWQSSHQISHASFLPKVLEIKAAGEGKPLADVVESIVKFLIRWLAFHILDNDKRMATCIIELQAGKSLAEAKTATEKAMSGSTRLLIEAILSMYDDLSSSTLAMLRERSGRVKAEEQLEQAVHEIKVLKGILPICAYCKRIRNTDDSWDPIESYIDRNSEAQFSHGICPDCANELSHDSLGP